MPDCIPCIKNLRKQVLILKYISISFLGLERSVQIRQGRSPHSLACYKLLEKTEGVFILTSRTAHGAGDRCGKWQWHCPGCQCFSQCKEVIQDPGMVTFTIQIHSNTKQQPHPDPVSDLIQIYIYIYVYADSNVSILHLINTTVLYRGNYIHISK